MTGSSKVPSPPSVLPQFSATRGAFHKALFKEKLLSVSSKGIPSIADSGSEISKDIARELLKSLDKEILDTRLPGPVAGSKFEEIVLSYLKNTYPFLSDLRSGKFSVEKGRHVHHFEQYEHLDEVAKHAALHRSLKVALGTDYLIKPDVVIARQPEPDTVINNGALLVDDKVARHASIRTANNSLPILHASVSCKWTLRSDRAQNARSEALNLIRNRKGRLPHIVVVTAEPTPGRIASLALGTADLDCVYHIALPELRASIALLLAAASAGGVQKRTAALRRALELLDTMSEGKRLRDIADLPLDLTV